MQLKCCVFQVTAFGSSRLVWVVAKKMSKLCAAGNIAAPHRYNPRPSLARPGIECTRIPSGESFYILSSCSPRRGRFAAPETVPQNRITAVDTLLSVARPP